MIPPPKNADIEIERDMIAIDRQLWKTLAGIKSICSEMVMKYIFTNTELSDMCQEAIDTTNKEQRGIEDAWKHKKDTTTFRWTV